MTKHLHYTLALLLFILIGGGKSLGQTMIWQEDWSGAAKGKKPSELTSSYNGVTYKESNTGTTIYAENLATGVSPELLVKGSSTFTVEITDLKGCTGELTLTFKTNQTNLQIIANGTESEAKSQKYDNTYKLNIGDATTLTLIFKTTTSKNARLDDIMLTGIGADKTPTEVTFGETIDGKIIEVSEGEEASFTVPKATLTPEEAGTITYSSSNTDVASVDATTGDVTFGSVFGTTIISAKYAGNETYTASEAKYTINYVKARVAGTIVFDHANNAFEKVLSENPNGGSSYDCYNNESATFIGDDNKEYTFTLNKTYRNGGLQMKNGEGSIVSPLFGLTNGYIVIVTTKTNDIKITSGELSAIGESKNCTLSIPTDATFTIEINGAYAVISKIEIVPNKAPETIILNETKENTITAAENVTVSLVRTLDNSDWNTFCVPFDISEEQVKAVFGEGTKITEFTSADQARARMIFSNAQSIKAGVPYFIKPGKAEVKNPSFEGVTIVEGEPKTITNNSNYSFVGVYSPYKMKTDGTELFIGAGGSLVAPAEESNTINGMRAFIRLSSTAVIKPSIDIDGNGTTGISIIENDTTSNGNVYDINGRLAGKNKQGLKKGIYIVNGKKIIIK